MPRAMLELTRLAAQVADRDRLLRGKDETIAELLRQVQRMAKQLRAGREAGEPEAVVVYADPERQFRHEVEQHWLTTVPEAERDAQPTAAPPSSVYRRWTGSSGRWSGVRGRPPKSRTSSRSCCVKSWAA